MRAWWTGVALAAVIVGCRTMERPEEGAGVERTQPSPAAEQAAPTVGQESEQVRTTRLLGAIQALSQAEIDQSKMAVEKASSPEVKSFAAMMIPDHQQDIDTIRQIAERNNLDVKGALENDPLLLSQKEAYRLQADRLRGLSGEAFDAAFMPSQPSDHVLLAQLAKQGAAASSDTGVDALSAQVERHAEDHRAAALRALPVACGGTLSPPGAAAQPDGGLQRGGARQGGGAPQGR